MYGKKAKMQAETGPHSCKPGRAGDRCPPGAARGEEGFYPESRKEHGPAGTLISVLWDNKISVV